MWEKRRATIQQVSNEGFSKSCGSSTLHTHYILHSHCNEEQHTYMEGRWDLLHTCKDGQDSSPHRNDRLQEVRGKLVERRKDTGLHTSISCSECPGLGHMTGMYLKSTGNVRSSPVYSKNVQQLGNTQETRPN